MNIRDSWTINPLFFVACGFENLLFFFICDFFRCCLFLTQVVILDQIFPFFHRLSSQFFKKMSKLSFLSILLSLLRFLENNVTGFDERDCCCFSDLFYIHFRMNTRRGFELASRCYLYSLFHVLTGPLIMEHIKPKVQKATGDNSLVWVDQDTLDTASTFVCEGGIGYTFTVVGSSEHFGVIFLEEDKRICNK